MRSFVLLLSCLHVTASCLGNHFGTRLMKRTEKEATVEVGLYNRGSFIGIKAYVGSPPQEVELLLDTGSSNSWIMGAENPYCVDASLSKNAMQAFEDSEFLDPGENGFIRPVLLNSKGSAVVGSQPCYKYGVFGKSLSNTYSQSSDKFHVKYLDNSFVDGYWSNDSITIGKLFNLPDFQFGIGLNSNSSMGILGLGIPEFKIKEGEVEYQHDNLVMRLYKKGLINRRVFSIWLNDKDTDGGKILFGAVDYAKFQAPLVTMKMVNTEHTGMPIQRYELMLTDVGLKKSKHEDEVSLFSNTESYNCRYTGALIDSGSMFTHLPEEVFEQLISQLHHIKIDATDQYLVESIDKDDNDIKLSFKFSSHRFNVPLRNFLLPKPNSYNKYINFSKSPNGKDYSLLNIMSQPSNLTILGQSFMRSLYTVFDIDKMEISMAPVNHTNDSEIRELTVKDGLFDFINDRNVAEELRLGIHDPQSDFIQDTENGYYEKFSSGSSDIKGNSVNQCLAKLLVSFTIVLLVILFV